MKYKKLVIAPHVDDDVLGCGGIMDADTFVLYCGLDESHMKHRPQTQARLDEAKSVSNFLGNKFTILNNKVNYYNFFCILNKLNYICITKQNNHDIHKNTKQIFY